MLFKIKSLIIDDELPAREEMALALKEFEQIEIIGYAKNGQEAITMINNLKPDVIFLDIEMPGTNGLDVLSKIEHIPIVIFCTAYNQYAIKAFEEDALDYLLKPIEEERLAKTIKKIIKQTTDKKEDSLKQKQLVFTQGNATLLTDLSEVYLCESQGNYVKFFFRNKQVLKHIALKDLLEQLPQPAFLQINRSQVVNTNFIESIKQDGRHFKIILTNTVELKSSRIYTQHIKNKNSNK